MTTKSGHRRKIKTSRVLLIVAGVLLIAVVFVVTVFFVLGQNSEEKKQYEAQVKQETQEFTKNLITELDEINIDAILNPDASESDTASTTEVPPGVITEAEKQVISEELAKLDDERKQRVLQTLSVAYSEALSAQKQEAFNMVESLIAQGKADWAALTAKGEATATNKVKLASEYLAKSKVMEQQMDASFDSLVSKMEEQLTAEGIDPTEIVAQYRAQYEQIKKENKNALMDKVLSALKN